MTHVMLVGNPNCGKTTLFNALTGEHQRVGHWPGVTVEKKTGLWNIDHRSVQVTDLPGIYALNVSADVSQDAQIATQQVIWGNADLFVNVLDACHLERHLYFTSQLLELGKPMIVALNMMDMAHQQGITIDAAALSSQLGCPVVEIQANREIGLDMLRQAIVQFNTQHFAQTNTSILSLPVSKPVANRLQEIEAQLKVQNVSPASVIPFLARRLLEEGKQDLSILTLGVGGEGISTLSLSLTEPESDDLDILMADARYAAIHQIVSKIQKKRSDVAVHWTARLDRLVLHRFFAIPIFLTLLYAMFFLAIHVGGAFQAFFDLSTDALFVQGSAWLLQQCHAPTWLVSLISMGVGKGLNTTLTFVPVMAVMFFLLAFLESSGYMARAAFVIDKLMRVLGLPGKSLIPLIVGFGCNVPAVMAARTLDNERERILTVLMSPFMSCSARLSIYAVFVAAFFPTHGAAIVFSLYLVGIAMAILTGFLLRHTLLKGEHSPLILEMPPYHRPSARLLMREMSRRLNQFMLRAGKLIIPICVVLGCLNAWMIDAPLGGSMSVLAWIGQCLTPIFAPMGIHPENWPAVVGLLTGSVAKEVVVGSLNSLYSQLDHVHVMNAAGDFNLWRSLQEAVLSIPQNLLALFHIVPQPEEVLMSQSTYGVMAKYFGSQSAAYAYLLFVLLYIPCISTIAAIRQETHSKYMWFSIVWSFFIAYATAVSFYQISLHITQRTLWVSVGVMLTTMGIFYIKRLYASQRGSHVTGLA